MQAFNEEELMVIMKSAAYQNPQHEDNLEAKNLVSQGFRNLEPPDNRNKTPEKFYVWRTMNDTKVRKEHSERDGEVFSWDNPPPGGHPGEDYNCRCWAEEYLPPDETKSRPFWAFSIKVKPKQYLKFDGRALRLIENNREVKRWKAVSGAKGYQSPENQNLKNKGPLPSGTYIARMSRYQEMDLMDNIVGSTSGFLSSTISLPKKGKWFGGSWAWGEQRIWLDPALNMETYGRDDFSIHGGFEPGSAGCIDLTDEMPGFAKWLTENNRDVIVEVDYTDF